MCLEQVDPKPTRKRGVGYKLVGKDKDGYYSFDYSDRAGTRYPPIGQWGKDPNPPEDVKAWNNLLYTSYTSGFHISLDAKPLRELLTVQNSEVIVKVRFRKVVATSCYGDHVYGKQVVAREIMIVEEVA